MSRTDTFGRITYLLIAACVVPAVLGLSILQAQAGGMPGSSRDDVRCGDSTGGSASQSAGGSVGGSACDCLHCREARKNSESRLRRFFRSHHNKWSEPMPHDSWKCYHPCSPYFQPTFGVHQTSWTVLQHDAGQEVRLNSPPNYSNDRSSSDSELRTSPGPAVRPNSRPNGPHEAIPGHVTPAAARILTGDSKRQAEQLAVVPNPKLAPLKDVPVSYDPAQPDSESIAPHTAFEFDKQTPDSLFTSHNDPIFRMKAGAGPRTGSHLK